MMKSTLENKRKSLKLTTLGFTLIELLAVIVILAIIAIIAVPIVLDIIKDTKESAMLRSADFYLDGVENAIAQSVLKGISIIDGTYPIMEDGNVCLGTLNDNTCTGDILKVEVDGEKPSGGSITIGKGTITSADLVLNDKTIILGSGGQLAITDGYTSLSDFEYYLGREHPIFNINYKTPINLAENEVLITKYKGESKEVVVPDTYTVDGIIYNVILLSSEVENSFGESVSGGTFNKNTNIESVTFTGNIKFISSSTDYCDGCDSDGSVYASAEYLFYECTNLKKVILPDSVRSIEIYMFSGCTSLTNITIPDSVTSIGSSAFSGCTSLKNVTIGKGVTSIGYYAFSGCTSLKEITIPNSITSIDGGAFSGCTSLKEITIPNSITSIDGGAFSDCTSLTSITIPESVTSIGYSAFRGCTELTSITIPEGVTSIGNSAFEGCTGLTSITIPKSVISIGNSVFSGCTNLTSITIPDSVTSIGSSAFSGCTSLTSITIPESVTSIGNSAFSGCTELTSITIPEGVTSIGNSAFEGCTGLTSITIPKSVISIGNSAFSGCTNLTSITIPDSVTSIGSSAFSGCTSLTSITIPESVTSIGNSAFSGCTNLTSFYYNGTASGVPWGAPNPFEDADTNKICKLIYGSSNIIGSKYQCKVKEDMEEGFEDGYYFYVLSKEEDGTTNLIMERNIYYDNTNDVGLVATSNNAKGIAWNSDEIASYGPVTAMAYLHNATKDWDNIPNMIMDYEDENIDYNTQQKGTNGYGSIKTTNNITMITSKNNEETGRIENLKARMPRYDEVHGTGKCLTYAENGNKYGSCPLWLANYLNSSSYVTGEGLQNINSIYEYYTLSSRADSSVSVWVVTNDGCMGHEYALGDYLGGGVRPVINIKL